MAKNENQKRKLTPAQENLICIITILGAGIGPRIILWILTKINIPIVELSIFLKLLFPPTVSIIIIFSLTKKLGKGLVSAILATLLSIGLGVYFGYRIPP